MIMDKWKNILSYKYYLPALKTQIGEALKSSASFCGHFEADI
jgi:hypothetical protein